MDFFDINCWVSQEVIEYTPGEDNANDIFKLFSENSIKKAVLTNRLSFIYDWNTGNSALSDYFEHTKKENIYLSFVLCPEAYHQFDFTSFIQKAYNQRARLFRIFPKSHLFYINDYYMQKIYNALSDASFPLMLDLKELDITGNKYFAIDDLRALLSKHRDLPFILQTSLKQCMFSRFYFPLLEEFENLYIEISGMLLMDQIEHYVEKFGSGKLIFGSNYPETDFKVNTSRMELSEISMADRENICFKNIDSIFKNIRLKK